MRQTTTMLIERLHELNKKFLAQTMTKQEQEEARDLTAILAVRGYRIQRGKRGGLRIHK
jgi:hypothetical protein